MNLTAAWEKFRTGDSLSNPELLALVADTENGIRFLRDRKETGGVLFKTLYDLDTLMGFVNARNLKRA